MDILLSNSEPTVPGPLSHGRVYQLFLNEFPYMKKVIRKYFPFRADDFPYGSVRILLTNGKQLIFGVQQDGRWGLRKFN